MVRMRRSGTMTEAAALLLNDISDQCGSSVTEGKGYELRPHQGLPVEFPHAKGYTFG